jgi:transposase
MFEGNKFEGHTFIPSIINFKNKHKILELTVVADAAMISEKNIEELIAAGLTYIVGARLGNISPNLIKKIGRKLAKTDRRTTRLKTSNGYLVCDFSKKRYNKDKHDLKKQINKAKELLKKPDKIIRRNKFLKVKSKTDYQLNQALIKKAKLLLGIKGYYTNLTKSNRFISKQYHFLWNIEKSFRISKSDLKMRPIYHFKTNSIQSHILICFTALAVVKYMEIKTGKSTQKIVRLLKKITDARILDLITNEEIVFRLEISDEIRKLLKQMRLPY